jgi:hypothetical protein
LFENINLRPLLVHVDEAILVVETSLADHSIRLALNDCIPEHDLILGLSRVYNKGSVLRI